MALEIKVPEVSEGVHGGTVVTLSVAVGDKVEVDQTLIELETDKAVVAIPSPQAGTVTEIRVRKGDEVEVGSVIVVLETKEDAEPRPGRGVDSKGQSDDEPKSPPQADKGSETSGDKGQSADAQREEARPSPEKTPEEPVEGEDLSPGRMIAPAAPSVRRKARELGVDIYQVQGSGPGGRISESDVRQFVQQAMQKMTGKGSDHAAQGEFPGLHAQRPLPDFSRWGAVSRQPLSRVRELTADAMSYAWSTIPMVTQYDKARITAIEEYRIEHNRGVDAEDRLSLTAILVKICAVALREFSRFNSSIDLSSRELILKESIHIGVAVDTPAGLLVPVIRDAGKKGIVTISKELNALAAKARERKINPADMEGGTFTLSNLGGIGGMAFTPLVYAPQVAILGVSRAEKQPFWTGQEFKPELVLPLSLTYDHRVVDGADGARFLRWVCQAIESPLELLMND